MVGWEYRTVRVLVARALEPDLNALGAEGWELVGLVQDEEGYLLVLKRPRG